MMSWVVEGYTNLHAHANGGHFSRHSLYATRMKMFHLLRAWCVILSVPYIMLPAFFMYAFRKV